jgi:hypothetical protein
MSLRPSDVRRLALALPEATEAPHHDMTSFRVANKIFATMPPTGDRVHIFVAADEVAASCAEFPGVVEELWWGKKLSGCRVMLAGATTPVVRELLAEAWRHKAPTTLVARLES